MKFEDVRDLLAERGLVGRDAETAFQSWQQNPHGADGGRVQAILESTDLSAESAIRFNADLKVSRDEHGMVSIRLNGEEMSRQIIADSVTITFPSDELGSVYVTMQVAADDFEIDLPDAEVEVK